jgi:signal transduction histidine kinase
VFDSAPGQGTVFRFTLPVAGAAPEAAPDRAQAAD